MRCVRKKLKGSVIGFSLMLLSLLLFSGITLVSVSVLERKASFATQKSIIAFQAADSGMERVLKRIYVNNSPAVATVPLNGAVTDGTLNTLAGSLADASGTGCSGGVVSGTNSSGTSYAFQVAFYDAAGALIACNNAQWRDRVIRVRSEGFYQRTSRAIETGVRPRE